ncbi:flagellar protein FlaG [Jeotgalibacillus haloalkalitolerans]|uniref:Flagellar protein FlaG n=1 Tax=Jeotgalibacillus haloalkalitolerans TaxID=3104292 RepID=A0ABU5KJS9_9BACL|nr:flagellar protein FlaG [Jeotgalibacillus sp. HH7-29]MDZ5711483.1 flagellar protein FlaG [Jeotgalibacillus sp. HH7-29]
MNRIGEISSSRDFQQMGQTSSVTQTEAIVKHTKEIAKELSSQSQRPKEEQLEQAVQGLNNLLKPYDSHLKFEYHEDLGEYYVTIVDDVSKEVIKEIPSKKLLDSYAAMADFLGILMDQKA